MLMEPNWHCSMGVLFSHSQGRQNQQGLQSPPLLLPGMSASFPPPPLDFMLCMCLTPGVLIFELMKGPFPKITLRPDFSKRPDPKSQFPDNLLFRNTPHSAVFLESLETLRWSPLTKYPSGTWIGKAAFPQGFFLQIWFLQRYPIDIHAAVVPISIHSR